MLAIFLLAVAVVPSGQAFICTPVRVWDGDGPVWCREGPRIRLAGIAAREIDGSCRKGHPCPRASGIAARDALVRALAIFLSLAQGSSADRTAMRRAIAPALGAQRPSLAISAAP